MIDRLLLSYLRNFPLDHGKGALAKRVRLDRFPAQVAFTACSGVNYALDLREYVQRNLFLYGDYERNTMRHVRRLIRPGDTIVDVGGNIGFYALEMARLNAPGPLLSFEPNPAALDRFKGNWELNPQLTNIQLIEHGLADRAGGFTLSFNRGNLGSASAYGSAPERIDVKVEKLDEVLIARGVERIDVMKIDIEGGELAALRGAERTIANSPRMMLIIEIIDDHCKRAGYSGKELFDLIVSMGFKGHLPKPWPFALKPVTAYDPGYFDNIIFLKGH